MNLAVCVIQVEAWFRYSGFAGNQAGLFSS